MHTQGSFCGFGCNPIYTLADLELGLAVIAHQDDGANSLGFKEVTDQVIFSVFTNLTCWFEIFLLNDLCFDFNLLGNSKYLETSMAFTV